MSRPIEAHINLGALQHNLAQTKALVGHSRIWAVIKANGYGHGLLRVAGALNRADGFAVASVDEALQLRQAGFLHPILLLEGLFDASELSLVLQHRLDLVVHSHHQVDWLLAQTIKEPLHLWLKLDTGMHRLGFNEEGLHQALFRLKHHAPRFKCHLMSHLACAEDDTPFNQYQYQQLLAANTNYQYKLSLANSAAIQTAPQTHLNWVRPGIMLYGAGILASQKERFKPVMTLTSRVIALKWIEAGEGVGYGQTWQASQTTCLAIVAVGYGDGYPRHATNGTPVLISGMRFSLVGRVSMDMITVDVTANAQQIKLNDPVELWGPNLSVDEVAEHANTIGYELLCGITQRVKIKELTQDEL
ncbi:alanine racemase [Thiomicrospira cyclica]|uniref:Alanine racemase n=1 Tax=Thiomicrospira cyclica (strain DSM 14477 / JCM 11371 / ALM1) TaxID=717773 RepID=F6DCJ0_THICA|nr:alanine racemase [Thiomicrospira cyclica]AEG31576.1 Alanine racemase [Thiomicrospira cyclica ALM1]